jgi:hypothetical protein
VPLRRDLLRCRLQWAPAIAEQQARVEHAKRHRQIAEIMAAKLPPKRKLKVVKERITRLLEIQEEGVPIFSDVGMLVIDYIQELDTDDPAFAECKTFLQYFLQAEQHKRKTVNDD